MPTYSTPEPITVVVNASSVGNVRVTAGEYTETVVEVVPTTATKSLDVTHADNTKVEYANGEMRIATPRHSVMSPRTRSVDITIQVPSGSIVRGTAGGGELRTRGELAECHFTVQGGSINVDKVGPATLETAAGDVRVAEALRGSVKAITQAGSVDIGVSRNASVGLTTKTMHGSVSNSLSAEHDGRQVTESVDVDIRVMAGDINVHRAADNANAVKRLARR